MRFMMLMIPKGYETAEPDVKLDPKRVEDMMKYNAELQKAGVLLALDGLHPPSTGARVSFPDGKPLVTDGPFAEAKEVIGGYAIMRAETREEMLEDARRFLQIHIDCGFTDLEIEVRPMSMLPDGQCG